MDKRGILVLSLLLLIVPAVNAGFYDFESSFYDFFGWGYYNDGGFLLLKVGIFVLLFTFLLKATEQMFKENRASAIVVALIISLMAVAFIPAEFIVNIGSISGVVGVLVIVGALLMLPWLLLEALGIDLGRGMPYVYLFILLAEIWALSYLAQNVYYDNPILDYLLSAVAGMSLWKWIAILVLGFIIAVGINRVRRRTAVVGGGGTP